MIRTSNYVNSSSASRWPGNRRWDDRPREHNEWTCKLSSKRLLASRSDRLPPLLG